MIAAINTSKQGFTIINASDAQLAVIKEMCSGYAPIMTNGRAINANKSIAARVVAYVNTQAAIAEHVATQPLETAVQKFRILVPVGFTDAQIIKLVGNVMLSGRGTVFSINEDHPSTHGDHLLGYEGSQGQYAYYTK